MSASLYGLRTIIGGPFSGPIMDFVPAVTRGLVDYRIPRLSAVQSARNYVTGESGGAVVGNPVYGPQSARFTAQSAYLQSANPATLERTIIAVSATPDDASGNSTSAAIAGNLSSSPSAGFFLGTSQAAGVASWNIRRVINVGGTTPTGALQSFIPMAGQNPEQPQCIVGRMTATSWQIFNKTRGLSGALRTTTEAEPVVLGGPVRYGSSSSSQTGRVDLWMLADYTVALTDAEIEAAYQQMKAFLAEESTPIAI